jgi:hypothetical protein
MIMPPRKSLDIDPKLSVLMAQAEKLKTDQKLMLGELVIETGIHKLMDADQFRDLLTRTVDQIKTATATRERKRTDATFSAQPETNAKPNGHADPEPARHRPADLLSESAAD